MPVEIKSVTYEELAAVSSYRDIPRILDRLGWPANLVLPPGIFGRWSAYFSGGGLVDDGKKILLIGSTRMYSGSTAEEIDLSNLRPQTVEPTSRQKILSIEQVASICQEANRKYCACLGDYSQLSWSDAPDWQRKSVIDGVLFNLNHFLNLGHPAEPGDLHKRWMARKVAEGWTYGPVKDEESQSHPCLMPFENLPVGQQVKDHLFTAIVTALAPFV